MSLLIRYIYLITLEIRQTILFSILYSILLSKFALIINSYQGFYLKLILPLIRNTNTFYSIILQELIIIERLIILYSYLLLVKELAFLRRCQSLTCHVLAHMTPLTVFKLQPLHGTPLSFDIQIITHYYNIPYLYYNRRLRKYKSNLSFIIIQG